MLFVRYSLGEEVTLKQITAHIATHGADGKLNLQQFKEVMMKVIGVSHTKEQLTASSAWEFRKVCSESSTMIKLMYNDS